MGSWDRKAILRSMKAEGLKAWEAMKLRARELGLLRSEPERQEAWEAGGLEGREAWEVGSLEDMELGRQRPGRQGGRKVGGTGRLSTWSLGGWEAAGWKNKG